MRKLLEKAGWNLAIAADQLGNALLGLVAALAGRARGLAGFGDPDETISSVLGKKVRDGGCPVCRGICWVLSKLDPRPGNHCLNSIEKDEGSRSVR